MNRKIRQKTLFLLALTTIGVILLASGLPEMQFLPGLPFPGAESGQSAENNEAQASTQMEENHSIPTAIFGFCLIALLAVLFFSLSKKITPGLSLYLFGGIIVFFGLLVLLNQIPLSIPVSLEAGSQQISTAPKTTVETAPIGKPPADIFQAVMIFLILFFFSIAAWLLYQILQKRQKNDLLANEVDAALKSIESGFDPGNAIVRCYLNMEEIIKEGKGIGREDGLTPREFMSLLQNKGIADEHIRQMVMLFEKVRYGNKKFDGLDEQAAVECLSAIRLSFENNKAKS